MNSLSLNVSFRFQVTIFFQKSVILFFLWIICIELRSALEVLVLTLIICSCIWVISCSCCCFSHLCYHYHLSSSELIEHVFDLDICFIMICIWVICCLIQFILIDCWSDYWLVIRNLNVLSKHFNEDSSSENVFSYLMNSDLSLFDENLTLEEVNLNFLTYFIISDSVIDNSLRFLSIKFCWNLVTQLICVLQ